MRAYKRAEGTIMVRDDKAGLLLRTPELTPAQEEALFEEKKAQMLSYFYDGIGIDSDATVEIARQFGMKLAGLPDETLIELVEAIAEKGGSSEAIMNRLLDEAIDEAADLAASEEVWG